MNKSRYRRALHLLPLAQGHDALSFASSAGIESDEQAFRGSCVVADLVMPTQDGSSLLAAMRSAGWSGPANVVSGNLTDGVWSLALTAGFAAVLAMPIEENVLVHTIAGLLNCGREARH